ncbi:MAG: LysM peptidoglycan-binding domain-containing protein, partial [Nitrospirae bacterium]
AIELCELAKKYWKEDRSEDAIELLDQAYSLILEVDESSNPELLQQKDDLRYLITKRLVEIYSSRIRGVKGKYNAIPLIINDEVQREIRSFQGRERDFFINAYLRSGLYRPMIVEELKKAGLPKELSWLPLIESGYKVRALSVARALGLWQFIPSTGYKFGLKRDTFIDERMDPYKSTTAAIEYLKELHDIFGDWLTVLAAYNCGEGRVLRVIQSQKVNYLDNFWDLYRRLPRETARYVPRFLATLAIVKNPEKYGFKLVEPYRPIQYDIVKTDRQMSISDIALKAGLDRDKLILLNAELRRNVTPPITYSLKVPKGKSEILLASLKDIPTWKMPVRKRYASYKKYRKHRRHRTYHIVRHRVRPGETLYRIAKHYNVSIYSIKKINRLRRHRIYVGQILKIPTSYKKVKRSRKKLAKKMYRVKKGDTLWLIAKRHGTTTKAIKRLNNLRGNCVYAGQVIFIPSS